MNIKIKQFILNKELTPFDIYSVFNDQEDVIFLDSSGEDKNLGRYSFIGLNPFLTIQGSLNEYSINGVSGSLSEDIFTALRRIINDHKCINDTEIPFIGGCIGYFSYDIGLELDSISHESKEDLILPQCYFNFYDNLIIFDNTNGLKYISSCGILAPCDDSIKSIENKLLKATKIYPREIIKNNTALKSNFTKETYMQTVSKVRDYIKSGDIYIANLTQRFTAESPKASYDIYRDLRQINPAPFSAFMKLRGFEVISSSPERFLKIEKGRVETRPIKGTRPRGDTSEEDKKNKLELINSEKDKAELLMIVDLQRNDLSKVCKPHSIKVLELFKLEEYSTVFHLVSTIEGYLKDDVDSIECMKNCFPGGSITGTPKIRAMEIIDELEGIKRNLYTGSIGYFGFDGNADFNIVIRTIIKKEDKLYFGVGGGITWDSDEESEYLETLDKAKALIRVI